MKIEKTIRDAFSDQLVINERVKVQVESGRNLFDENWHFVSRLKSDESFALKVEAGLCDENLVIDDFYACTWVVRNSSEIAKATKIVEDNFDVVARRPLASDKTTNRPTDFQFDDLRMYVRLKPGYAGSTEIHSVIFEIQIKTFLQHAWGIATHDLTYKTDEVSWARFRVASQIRAMLEHAELSIERFESLAGSQIIAKEFDDFVGIHEIIVQLRSRFVPAALPKDLQRLAKVIGSALRTLGVTVEQCMKYLDEESNIGRGVNELNLSPYSIVIQAVLARHSFKVADLLSKAAKSRYFRPIRLSKSVNVPASLNSLVPKVITTF
ncbi:hypothetical protein [Pararhizobium sp. LjRoot238]|uniref:hypothetical protein n=1 Tax=Pararhizobium sp. LjRoot238 TaxID=3342293 RepID=UPI003ECDB070